MGKGRGPGLAEAAKQDGRALRAAIYDRVSFDKRGDARSVGEQKTANIEACDQQGWVWSAETVYTDNDLSASRFAKKPRPDWQRLLTDLEDKKYEVVVLWESARGSRDLAGWIEFLDLCRNFGILIHITVDDHTYDVNKRREYKTLAEEGLDSADESEKGSDRINRAMESNALKGIPQGRLQYGFRREYATDERGRQKFAGQFPDETVHTTLSVDGETVRYTKADVVREIITRMASGEPALPIARSLNARGIPTPEGHQWQTRSITQMAARPAYAGIRVWHGKRYDGCWEPLVPAELHFAVVSRLEEGSKRWAERPTKLKHLGSGLYVCGVCGSPVRPMARYWGMAYTCTPPVKLAEPGTKVIKGRHVVRNVEHVDGFVQKAIWLRLARADLAELLAVDRDADARTAELTAEITEKQRRLDEASDAYARGELSLARLMRIESTLEPDLERLRAKAGQYRVAPVLRGLDLPTVGEVEQEWWSRSLPQRREIVRALTEKIEILQVGKGRRHYTPEESVRIVWRGAGEPVKASGD